MPNNPSREAFEATWIEAHPEWVPSEGIAKDDKGVYWYTDTRDAWRWWQAGAQHERDRINAEHSSRVPHAEMAKLESAVKVLRDRGTP